MIQDDLLHYYRVWVSVDFMSLKNFLEILIYNHVMHFNIILCLLNMKIKPCIFAAIIKESG